MTANIIPSDPLKLQRQAKLIASLRDENRNLKVGISERDERIAELETKLDKMIIDRGYC
ncbi:hypothetical protein G7084_00205 [Weissella coleopterorum]|uniref:Uncharacterized protein n=1 Tax=Weissella coleopterorum TaxID=2714949 RepID=A0A6G8AXQ1_9LACO|nr:hypothetical protein [Weissella coleopterorum]QIL49881.1 hypothetical protein G7084_00205 [Weissella coleopterorum]